MYLCCLLLAITRHTHTHTHTHLREAERILSDEFANCSAAGMDEIHILAVSICVNNPRIVCVCVCVFHLGYLCITNRGRHATVDKHTHELFHHDTDSGSGLQSWSIAHHQGTHQLQCGNFQREIERRNDADWTKRPSPVGAPLPYPVA